MRNLAVVLSITFASLLNGHAVELAGSHPEPEDGEVAVSSSLHLRFSDALDPKSLENLTLRKADSGEAVPVRRSTDLTNASITISPRDFLEPGTTYRISGSEKVLSARGVALKPFSFDFDTGDAQFDRDGRLRFVPEVFDRTRSMTTVLFGPDRRLYAASAFGELVRWDLDSETGKPVRRTVLDQDPGKSRQYIDLEWDPDATAKRLILWVSYAERISAKEDPRHFFTGKIARVVLDGDRVGEWRDVVVGLPHGREKQGGFNTLPHQPNGLCFHEGKLYQSVGSTTSSGGPANWGVAEQPLSAAILEVDYQAIREPVDVFPESGYDPYAESAPVRLFATGVRNALEILAHSNGRLYTAVNINDRQGPGDGVPDDPGIPGDQNSLVKDTTPNHESLYILKRGAHYGFPNPSRNQFVLNGGNPTKGADPYEIADYPVGTSPEKGFASELMYPIWQWGGTSPNGMIEYQPGFAHPLKGAILCCFYSARDIAVLRLGSDGLPTSVEGLRNRDGKLPFAGPLDITQDPETGILYIADFGAQSKFGSDGSMIELRPLISGE